MLAALAGECMSKTLRQFQCRDDLWTRVEALAKRRGISPDDIIQAALLQLFKSGKKKEANEDTPPPPPSRSAAATTPRPAPPPSASTAQRPVPRGLPRPTSAPAPAPGASASGVKPSLPRPTSSSPRLPPPSSSASRAQPQTRPLYLCFENQWYVVDKEEFVIGRGAKYSDLPIKDANISRRHCAIVRRGADYFIKDLGSTNGVEFGGERVDNHRIAEGSVYYLCDHELRFSFNAPA
ncbi:MAG: FHA domain-containing protein [Myxococcales bacterium]|nr:FHA domain-containing protein [Myxococcales bacterium]